MCWLYVPDMVGWSLDSTEPPEAVLARSATWKGKPRQRRFWLATWKRAGWLRRLSGVTLPHSTAALGVERWISSLLATRASPNPSPANDSSQMMGGGSGRMSPASSANAGPRSCLRKTLQLTLQAPSPPSSGTFPRSGMMRRGHVLPRPKLAPPTGAIGFSGLLPTPTASSATRGKAARGANAQGGPSLGEVIGPGLRLNPRFVEWMMGLPAGWVRLS